MISAIEISAIIILVAFVGILIWFNYQNWTWIHTSKQGSRYRSFNVKADGSTNSLTLYCPEGYEISVDKVFAGTGPNPNSSHPEDCYSELQDDIGCKMPTGVYDSSNGGNSSQKSTILSDKCDGKTEKCTIDLSDIQAIYTASGRNCIYNDCIPYIFGIYECKPKKDK